MVNCQQLYFCFPYRSLYKVVLKCKRKVLYWSYMHVLYNLMYRLKWTLYRLYEIMKIFSTWKYILKLILSRSKACFFKIHQRNYHDLAPNFFSLVLCKSNMHLSSIRCKRHPPFFVPKNAKKKEKMCFCISMFASFVVDIYF